MLPLYNPIVHIYYVTIVHWSLSYARTERSYRTSDCLSRAAMLDRMREKDKLSLTVRRVRAARIDRRHDELMNACVRVLYCMIMKVLKICGSIYTQTINLPIYM